MMAEHEERRTPPEIMSVSDQPMEASVKLNNILTALVLGVMGWVGFNINHMTSDISLIRTAISVQAVQIDHVRQDLKEHRMNKSAHK